MFKGLLNVTGLAFATCMMALVTPANAVTYNFNFDGAAFDVFGQVTTDGFDVATNISGTITGPQGGGSFNTLIPTGTAPWTGTWSWDNIFANLVTPVTNGGILWQNADNSIANLYSVGSLIYLSVANPDLGFYNPGDLGTLTFEASPVPVPAALPLLASAVGGIGIMGWRRRRKGSKPLLEPSGA